MTRRSKAWELHHDSGDLRPRAMLPVETTLRQLLDLIAALWRERRCLHRWDEQKCEPPACAYCGTSRKDRR